MKSRFAVGARDLLFDDVYKINLKFIKKKGVYYKYNLFMFMFMYFLSLHKDLGYRYINVHNNYYCFYKYNTFVQCFNEFKRNIHFSLYTCDFTLYRFCLKILKYDSRVKFYVYTFNA